MWCYFFLAEGCEFDSSYDIFFPGLLLFGPLPLKKPVRLPAQGFSGRTTGPIRFLNYALDGVQKVKRENNKVARPSPIC
jgi:hypothetical protein